MAVAFFELEQLLRSQKERMTLREEDVIHKCKSKIFRDFDNSFLVTGSAVAAAMVAAPWKLSVTTRFGLMVGSGFMSGMVSALRSLQSCVDHILSLDGSRLQRELANLIVQKHQDNSWSMRLVHRHFYSEKVFDDLSSDNPITRLRHRSCFSDNVVRNQETPESDSNGERQSVPEDNPDTEKTAAVSKQAFVNNHCPDEMEDPLDALFSSMAPFEEIHNPRSSTTASRAHGRSHRRAQRRHRIHRHEVAST